MAHMCVKLSPLSLEWPQSTGTKCMLSHDHVFVAPVLEFYLLGERESVLLSTHTTQAHPRKSWPASRAATQRGTFAKHTATA